MEKLIKREQQKFVKLPFSESLALVAQENHQ
jgi:hypothetical protein